MKERRRRASKGILIFSSLLILIGSVSFISVIVSLFLLNFQFSVPGMFSLMPLSTIQSSIFWVSTIIGMFIMLSWIVAGIGMLLLQEWARQALLTSMGIYFLNCFVNILLVVFMAYEYFDRLPMLYLILGIVFVFSFSVSSVHFFTHPNIIKQFQHRNRISRL